MVSQKRAMSLAAIIDWLPTHHLGHGSIGRQRIGCASMFWKLDRPGYPVEWAVKKQPADS